MNTIQKIYAVKCTPFLNAHGDPAFIFYSQLSAYENIKVFDTPEEAKEFANIANIENKETLKNIVSPWKSLIYRAVVINLDTNKVINVL